MSSSKATRSSHAGDGLVIGCSGLVTHVPPYGPKRPPVTRQGDGQATEVSSRRRAELASAVALRRVLERLACGQDGQLSDGQGTGTWDFPAESDWTGARL